uniref:Gbp1 n=1 Tax=Griffithsia japonica TaxID=83288 RepID=Q7XZ56_GRIJA|nr:Gbp1 [Griffithsia japonica]
MDQDQPPPPQSNGAAPQTGGHSGGKRVYVGNLSWDTRWQGLKDHMREAGDVVHAEVFTEASGRSAGCGIVEFENSEGAETAISTLNDTMLDGRTIFVRADREEGKPSRGRYGDGDGSFRGRPSDRGRKIVVWNLPYHIRWQDLKDLFRDYGERDSR